MKIKRTLANLPMTAVLLALCATSALNAETYTWEAAFGDWNEPINWGGVAPTDLDEAIIANSGTAQLPVGVSGSYNSLYLGYGSGTGGSLEITGGVLEGTNASLGFLSGSGSAVISSGTWSNSSLSVGYSGIGNLQVNGGLVSATHSSIGADSTGVGTATITSGTWTSGASLRVGGAGTGSLLIGGGVVASNDGWIGMAGVASGTATVSDGEWNITNSLHVGDSGTGSLDITGGSVSAASTAIGAAASGSGSVTVSSGTLTSTSELIVGKSGSGSLSVEGGLVTGFESIVGRYVGSSGTAVVSAGTWENSNTLTVGAAGTGELMINGGLVTAVGGYVGTLIPGTGIVTVNSGTWVNTFELIVGQNGEGALNLNNGGTVVVQAGSGILTLAQGTASSGTLNITNGGTLTAAEVTGGAGLATVNFSQSGSATFSSQLTGSLAVNKSGTGTTVLGGINTYEGATTIQQGILSASGSAFSANSVVTLFNAATLDLGDSDQTVGGLSGNGTVALGSHTLTVDPDANSTFSGAINGTGGLVKQGTGEWELQNSVTYTGGTRIEEGALKVTLDANLGAASGGLTFDGGTLRLAASPIRFVSDRSITLEAGGGTLDTGTRAARLTGIIDGTGSLTKEGAGSLTLTEANTYSGGTILEAGSLWINADNRLGDTAGSVTLNGGSLGVSATTTSNRDFILEGGSLETSLGATHTLAGDLSGSGALIKNGLGTLALSGSNSHTGGTQVNAGTLQFSANDHLGSGAVVLNGGSLRAAGNYATNENLTLQADSRFEVLSAFSVDWDGQIDGGTLTKAGTGLLRLTNSGNTLAGTVVSSGTLAITNAAAIGTEASVQGGTLAFEDSLIFDKDLTVTSGALRVESGETVVLTGNLGNTYSFESVTKTGLGTLVFSGNNSHSGLFTISQGTAQAGQSGAFASFSGVTIQPGSTLDLNNFDNQIGTLSGSTGSTIQLGSGTLTVSPTTGSASTFAGTLSGSGGVVKAGNGSLTLSGNNSYEGGTLVTGGILRFASLFAVPDLGLITNQSYVGFTGAMNQAFLDSFDKANSWGIIGLDGSTSSGLNLLSFHADARIGSTSISGVTFSGPLTPQASSYRFGGGGGLITASGNYGGARDMNVANGSLHLTGTNSYNQGSVAEAGGVLVFVGADALPAAGALTAQAGGYIGSAHVVDQSFLDRFDKSATAGTVGVNVSTASDLDLTGFHANARLGTTEPGVTVSGSLTPQGSTYRFGGGGGDMHVSSSLTGARSVDVDNMVLTLAGTNDYSGGTVVGSGGALQADSDSRLGTGTLTLYGTFRPLESFTMTRDIVTHGGWFEVMTGDTLTLAGDVSGSTLRKTGWGTLALSGSNSHSATEIWSGTLRTESTDALGTNGSVDVYSSGTLDLNGFSQSLDSLYNEGTILLDGATLTANSLYSIGSISGDGGLVKSGSGTFTLFGNNSYTGPTTLAGGLMTISSGSSLGTGTLNLQGGTLQTSGTLTLNNAINASGTTTIDVDTQLGGNTLTVDNAISGNGTLIKTGDGTMILVADSSHSGLIDITEGAVDLAGNTASDFSVNAAGARLIGTGTTSGNILVANGGVLNPGHSPGTLEVGSAEFGELGIYEWEIDAPNNHDFLLASGPIEITATNANPFTIKLITLDASGEAGFMDGFNMAASYSWIIATGSSLEGFASENFILDLSAFYNPHAGPGQFGLSQQGNSLVLQYNASAVPEPATALLLTAGLGLLALRRTRRSGK